MKTYARLKPSECSRVDGSAWDFRVTIPQGLSVLDLGDDGYSSQTVDRFKKNSTEFLQVLSSKTLIKILESCQPFGATKGMDHKRIIFKLPNLGKMSVKIVISLCPLGKLLPRGHPLTRHHHLEDLFWMQSWMFCDLLRVLFLLEQCIGCLNY